MTRFPVRLGAYFLATTILGACAVGPDYVRPSSENPAVFKESQNWKQAQPKDDAIRDKWWEPFGDPELNKLEEQVQVSNQNVKAAEAAYRQAQALVSEAQSAYFPAVTANAGITRTGTGSHSSGGAVNGNTVSGGGISNNYNVSLGASWEPDIWGKIRREVEASKATAEASNAELGAARLSAQATLASDYMSLRFTDEQARLLKNTADNDERIFKITDNLYKSGVDSRSDYLQAKAQLEAAQAQFADVGVARAQYEHAIAVLVGKAPEDLSIAVITNVPSVPAIPLGVPSDLLERRPDIANTERLMAAANAQIGVAYAAYFPDLTLSASGGYQSTAMSQLFSLPSRVWSLGPNLAETIFDAGLRQAQVTAAKASYEQTVANYRQTVLSAFQEVEDNLAALRILEQEADTQSKAVADAQAATKIIMNQYKSGTVSYLNVATAQNTELSDELTYNTINKERLVAAATLITDLGGGWQMNPPAPPPPADKPAQAASASAMPADLSQKPAVPPGRSFVK